MIDIKGKSTDFVLNPMFKPQVRITVKGLPLNIIHIVQQNKLPTVSVNEHRKVTFLNYCSPQLGCGAVGSLGYRFGVESGHK